MGQFSMYLLYGAVMLLYWGYAELRKPKEQRKLAKAAICLVIGIGYFVYAWMTRGAMALAAMAVNTTYLIAGGLLLLLAALKALGPPPFRNRVMAALYGLGGAVLIALGLGLV